MKLDSIQNLGYDGVNKKYTFKGIPTMFKFVSKSIGSNYGNIMDMTLFGESLYCLVDLAINYEFFAYIATNISESKQNVNNNVTLYDVSRIERSDRNQTFSLTLDSTYTMTEQKLFKLNFIGFTINLDIYYYF